MHRQKGLLSTEYVFKVLAIEKRGSLSYRTSLHGCLHTQDLQQDFAARLQAAKEDADAKNAEIIAELDKFRRAFAGDPLGWATATDEQGKPYYYNSETGKHLLRSILHDTPAWISGTLRYQQPVETVKHRPPGSLS